jgi:hypothetical protein
MPQDVTARPNAGVQQPMAPQQPAYQQQSTYQQRPPAPGWQGFDPSEPPPPKPSSYLAGNIIMCILGICFSCIGVVPGIVGIVFSAMVNSRYNTGDFSGAKNASRVAKIMFFVSLGFVILGVIVNIWLIYDLVTYGSSSVLYDYMY